MSTNSENWKNNYDEVEGSMFDCYYDDHGYILKHNNLFGFATLTGTEIIPCVYDGFKQSYGSTVSACFKGKWGALDVLTGRTTVPFLYESLKGFTIEGENPDLAVFEATLFGLLNVANGEIVLPAAFTSIDSEEITDSRDLVRATNTEGKHGFIDQQGRVAISPIYDEAPYIFSGDSIGVALGSEKFMINRLGRRL